MPLFLKRRCDRTLGRPPIWAAYGDLGLTVDEYRELAPSLPVLTSDLEDPQGPAYDGVIHAGDHSPGRNATQTIRRCSMYFIRDPPCKVYRVVPEFTT